MINCRIDDEDPAWDYQIIPMASKMWMLPVTLDKLTMAAHDHSRLQRLAKSIDREQPDTWFDTHPRIPQTIASSTHGTDS